MRPLRFVKTAAAMVMTLLLCLPFAKAQTVEDGTEEHPFLIENLNELKAFRDGINSTAVYGFFFYEGSYITDTATNHITGAVGIPRGGFGKYFKLTTDIVMNEGNVGGCNGVAEDGWEEWEPIGWHANASQSFGGYFDGDFHTISGLYINGGETKGLFGSVVDGEVRNVAVTNSYIRANRIAGGICAWNTASTISHCWSSATIVADRGNAGGIVGYNTASVVTQATVEYCYNAGLVRSSSLYAGGIVGYNFGGAVRNCYNSNSVLGEGEYSGAITGSTENGGTVEDCYYDNLFAYIARDGALAASTNQMTTNAVAAVLGGEYTFTTGIYPQLTRFTTSSSASQTASLFSVTPIQLPASSDANGDNGVNGDITLGGSSMGITWSVSNNRASISGNTVSPVLKGDFRLSAYVGNCAKVWFLISRTGLPQGTEDNAFTFEDLESFMNFRDQLNSGSSFYLNGDPVAANGEGVFFKLTSDIDINPDYSWNYVTWSEGDVSDSVIPWVSIGTPEVPFKGHFDGGGHTIAGIYGNPLFGVVENATIENVGLIRGYINSGKHFGYVTDGLIMHYDGIQNTRAGHDANAEKWEDLVGNYDLTPFTYETLEWGEDHGLLVGDSAFWASGMSNSFVRNNGTGFTVEFVTYMDCDRGTPASRGLMGGRSSSTGAMNINSYTGGGRVESVAGVNVADKDDEVITLTYAVSTGCFLNGLFKTATFPVSSAENNPALVFGNSYIDPWGMRGWNDSIYAIRIYNRNLTSAEIRRNADVD
ncbi:MAG: hypothetical protein IJP72_03545, partial [Bacteroidales bacterium]|nr:hypothetical protein [Bacteroidales bacterium]